jgi:DNA polymerase delta subunit 3
MVRADDQAAMEAMMDMDFDFDDEDTSTKPSATKGAKRKTRRVKKSKVEMDDKGYMGEWEIYIWNASLTIPVTKDYYTDETYSGSDTDTEPLKKAVPKSAPPPTKPKAPAAASSAPAGGVKKKGPTKPAPMGQSTLAGFFKKK